jgi:hypothetical protein
VGASADVLGFLLAAGGLHTASRSRSLYIVDPQVKSRSGFAISSLDFSLLFLNFISRTDWIDIEMPGLIRAL